ncbi:chitosanase [Candidatus Nitrotoga sp. M5]|uniref:chitosanase n=1 Tax=Candidatus Nitrotoga sp. M5 TaxID=2890409 RepID=UPI001EF2DE64|nr:peptidoglycan-binding protein [Candidatus Nitrotoga sp. M5]CAH1386120.1 Chitosanase [Candidatus Nitrotoga sp. M5]
MLTTTQKKTAESLVNIFETGRVLGDYGQVTLIAGDTGHLTFGRSQTTLGSGNLNELLQRYCANAGARFGSRIAPYLSRFAARDLKLDKEAKLHNLLRASADDNVMRDTQDTFFDEAYWQPAARTAKRLNITSPLGVAVVYDSFVHGSWRSMRNRTIQQVGDNTSCNEHKWITTYIAIRRAWLANSSRADLRATVYRMDAFQRLIDQDYWGLPLPLVVRGQEISTDSLSATPRGCYDGPQPGTRSLVLQSPLQRGLDVRLLQLGLSDRGIDIKADGIFGQTSLRLVKEYQYTHNLPVTGVADLALIARLVE